MAVFLRYRITTVYMEKQLPQIAFLLIGWSQSVLRGFHGAGGRADRSVVRSPVHFQTDTPLGANTSLLHDVELVFTRLRLG